MHDKTEGAMPIYEYRCHHCGKRVSIFLRSFAAAEDARPHCPSCQSQELRRLVSRVATLTSEENRIESLADPSSLGDVDENDPRSVARWMRHMGQETGEDLGPEFGEVVDRLEAGQSPEEIEQDLPDLGLDADSAVGP
jgi:putative FmdB family regulatory protein